MLYPTRGFAEDELADRLEWFPAINQTLSLRTRYIKAFF